MVVVTGTAVAALVLRPEGGPVVRGRGPLGHAALLVIALAAAWLVAAMMLRDRYESTVGYDRVRTPLEQRLTDVVRYTLIAIPFVVPLLLLGLHRFSAVKDDRLPSVHPPHIAKVPPRRLPTPKPTRHPHPHHDSHPLLLRVLFVIGIALLLVLVALAAGYLVRRLRRPAAPASDATYAELDDEHRRLAQAVDSGRRALLDGGDARAAVIACYAAMESSLAASGVTRRASDSPQDLLERAAASGLLAGPAAADLTALFREARYSTHPMDAGHRDRAAAALARIAAELEAAGGASAADAAGSAPSPAAPVEAGP